VRGPLKRHLDLARHTIRRRQDAGELRFGVDSTYAPFESKSPSGQLVGFEIDLGNEICRRLNVRCVWVETAHPRVAGPKVRGEGPPRASRRPPPIDLLRGILTAVRAKGAPIAP
jgi:hypothetical protein